MCERVKAIHEYYTNLEYNEIDREKALTEMSNLCKEIQFYTDDDFSKRFLETARVIKKNLSLFQSVCEHVDIVTTIIEYLNHFGMKFMLCSFNKSKEEDEIISVMYTLFSICAEPQVQLFLKNAIINNSKLEESSYVHEIHNQLTNQINEMILLADSDLYAVISHLMITKNFNYNKIWIQQPIKWRFLSFIKKYCAHLEFSIHMFRSKQELLTSSIPNKMNIVSIWSEDIIAAKNLATSLNRDVLFINTHMDLYGGVVLLPYIGISHKCLKLDQDEHTHNTIIMPNADEVTVYSLFYDGMWQKPMKNTYWINKGSLWANATSDDIKKCTSSAEKGAKIWSTWSTDRRIQALSKFASTLECNGKFLLADIVSNWIKFPYFYENTLLCPQSGRLEVTTIRKPCGVIILKAGQETFLFRRLIQALITGNSVIVICNAITCTLTPYCDMFSTSGIPPGVINMLLRENIEDILKEEYDCYERQLFPEKLEKTYIKLTIPKEIILPFK